MWDLWSRRRGYVTLTGMEALEPRTIIITGGGQGLGFEIAKRVVERGAHAILLDVDDIALKRAQKEIGTDRCDAVVCDISDPVQVESAFAAIAVTNPGGVDALVNNAGVFTSNAMEQADRGRAARAIDVNIIGTMNVTNLALDRLALRADSGQIVFINSSAGDPLSTGTGKSERTYAATKGALTAYAKAIEGACAGSPIRVTTIYPGGMDTNLYVNAGMSAEAGHGQSWMMSPSRVADAVAFVLAMPVDTNISRLTIGPNL